MKLILLLSCLLFQWIVLVSGEEASGEQPICSDDADIAEDTTAANSQDASNTTPSVVVIGCGPGGMFFLHALASKRRKWQEAVAKGGIEAKRNQHLLDNMPTVTVFEKAAEPGGLWRPNSMHEREGSVNMFGGLWTNSPSFDTEFFDYTYDQHFEESVSLYLPRAKLLEYMKARVTSVEDIFQHVSFNTEVTWVQYIEDFQKFEVTVKNVVTGEESVDYFDQCIWAGGILSALKYPKRMHATLKRGGFKGTVVHSGLLVNFGSELEGKRVVLVGDNYSAEDMALQALKLGAEHVYMTSARGNGWASSTSSWPGNRLTNLRCLTTSVINNGTGLLCTEVTWSDRLGDYVPIQGASVELEDIALVIYCTGYETNMEYMADDLQYSCLQNEFSAPPGWISQHNSLTKHVGHVEPSDPLPGSRYVCDNIYRHALIDNPNMMYIYPTTDYFIPDIDANAWALAAYVTGETFLPSRVEMLMRNDLDRFDELQIPKLRVSMDENYQRAVDESDASWITSYNRTVSSDLYLGEDTRYAMKLIARDQVAGGHGGGWGSYDMLSERGEKIVDLFVEEDPVRRFPVVEEETEWRTFRDTDHTPFESIYTGIMMAPLKGHWMDLADDGSLLPHLVEETESS